MERIVIKLADPAVEPGELAQQAADLASRLPGAEVVRVSGSGRVLLMIPDDASASALEQLSSFSTVAWAESDGTDSAQSESAQSDSAQSESTASDVAQPGVAQPTDGDPQPS
ncbi:hypothetical protein GCM10027020_18690 [Nocardioides salsibiostraticola]